MENLLADIDRIAAGCRPKVILTLNRPGETVNCAGLSNADIEIVRNEIPKGFGANHNAAFKRAGTDFFAVLNPDLRIPQDVFTGIVKDMIDHEKVALIAPRVLSPTGEIEDSVRENLTPLSLISRHLGRSSKIVDVQTRTRAFLWFAGMAMVFRSAAFRSVGGFDEKFFLYCEDYDVCLRLRLAGWDIGYDRNHSVIHDARRDSHRSRQHLKWHLQSLAKVWTSRVFWQSVWRF